MELLKNEMKIELKRLQRQNMETLKDFEEYQVMYDQLVSQISSNDQKQVLNDVCMATIFKLLRIQYALSHQDERDKQDIFLMGAKMADSKAQQAQCAHSEAQTQADDANVDQNSISSAVPMSSQSKRQISPPKTANNTHRQDHHY